MRKIMKNTHKIFRSTISEFFQKIRDSVVHYLNLCEFFGEMISLQDRFSILKSEWKAALKKNKKLLLKCPNWEVRWTLYTSHTPCSPKRKSLDL